MRARAYVAPDDTALSSIPFRTICGVVCVRAKISLPTRHSLLFGSATHISTPTTKNSAQLSTTKQRLSLCLAPGLFPEMALLNTLHVGRIHRPFRGASAPIRITFPFHPARPVQPSLTVITTPKEKTPSQATDADRSDEAAISRLSCPQQDAHVRPLLTFDRLAIIETMLIPRRFWQGIPFAPVHRRHDALRGTRIRMPCPLHVVHDTRHQQVRRR